MFCVTFYSFKGGVGRTLALANVAASLACNGRRVLVVDFDLEAPGLTSFPAFKAAEEVPGIVDYVSDYLRNGRAPKAKDYIKSCELIFSENDEDTGETYERSISIDVMPAGRDADEGYATRLCDLDWGQLYSTHNGFLLMEDLRAQWQNAGYDYVLIDSRTGHTDVGGICTRQLPDAVVAVFFPNEQNLSGLKQIVRSIRRDGARPQPIKLLFAASRIPRLDDEHGHLRNWIRRSNMELENHDSRLLKIEHYDSLMLLDQAIFVLDRPKTGLARQYREIASSVARLNPEDAIGAFDYLNLIAPPQGVVRLGARPERPDPNRMESIGRIHADDTVVQWALARAYRRIRNLKKSLEACDLALAADGKTQTKNRNMEDLRARVHFVRMKNLADIGSDESARQEAQSILSSATMLNPILLDALTLVSGSPDFDVAKLFGYPAFTNASSERLFEFAEQLAGVPGLSEATATVAEAALQRHDPEDDLVIDDITSIQLVLIETGNFSSARKIGELSGQSSEKLNVSFNTAMADWGCNGAPDKNRFVKTSKLFEQQHANVDDANFEQCKALTYAVLGDIPVMKDAAAKALGYIEDTGRNTFSCWTYTEVSEEEFRSHVHKILSTAEGSSLAPEFISR